MPEPIGSEQTPGAAEPVSGFLDALEALVDAGPAYGGPDSLDPTPASDEPVASSAAPSSTETPVDPSTPVTALGEQPVDDDALLDDTASTTALDGGTPPEGGEQGQQGSRRGTWRELEAAKARIAELEAGQSQPATTPAPSPTADDAFDRTSVLDFLGMAAPVDDDGQPTGDEPLYQRLHREAQSPSGIAYEDEQKQYAELSQRGAMAGKIFGLARQVAWQEITDALVEPEIGLDRNAVAATGGMPGYKRAYREALEKSVSGQKDTEVAGLRAAWDQERAALTEQVAAANRKLEEQTASHQARFAQTRGFRAPVSGGRSAPATPVAAVPAGTSDQLTDQLAGWFSESAASR